MVARASGAVLVRLHLVAAFALMACGDAGGKGDGRAGQEAGGAGGDGAGGDGGAGGMGGASLPLTEEECFGRDFDCEIACEYNATACSNFECLDPPLVGYCEPGRDACREVCEELKASPNPSGNYWWNCLIRSEADCDRYWECEAICREYLE